MIVIIFSVLGSIVGLLIFLGALVSNSIDEKVFGAIIGLLIIAISIIGLLPNNEEQPKKMTINYEFRDSVYIPIDTVINNN